MRATRRAEAAFRADALPLISSGVTLAEDGDGHPQHYPTVQVDVRRRPDVADLPRVHAMEGPGHVRTSAQLSTGRRGWFGGRRHPDLMRLDITVSSPLICTFAVVLDVERHRRLLQHVAQCDRLVIATSPSVEPGVSWLALSLDGGLIGALLAEADTADR